MGNEAVKGFCSAGKSFLVLLIDFVMNVIKGFLYSIRLQTFHKQNIYFRGTKNEDFVFLIAHVNEKCQEN